MCQKQANPNSDVTVVIPTYNRCQELEVTLPTYSCSRCVKEVLVVSNGSIDGTSKVIQDINDKMRKPVKEIQFAVKLGAQKAKAIGLAQSQTKYVLFGEDDVYLSPNYIETLYLLSEEYNCDIISGKIIDVQVGKTHEIERLIASQTISLGFPQDHRPFVVPEQNLKSNKLCEVPFTHAIILVKSAGIKDNFFNPWYRGNGYREETDLLLNARESGMKVFFTHTTCCYHLRGSMSRKGGQRINRVLAEFWAMYNTWYMLKKHWNLLSNDFNLKCGPLFNTFLYFLHRERHYLLRLVKGQW